jgi:hypothetical protein
MTLLFNENVQALSIDILAALDDVFAEGKA